MSTFKNKISKAWSMHGWSFYQWAKGQQKTMIAGAIVILTWALVSNDIITPQSAGVLGTMIVTGLLSVLQFYAKEVELKE